MQKLACGVELAARDGTEDSPLQEAGASHGGDKLRRRSHLVRALSGVSTLLLIVRREGRASSRERERDRGEGGERGRERRGR